VKVSDESTRKRGFDEIEPAISRFAAANVDCSPIGDTIDEDEPQEVEMFESRQQILNYCQTNHFQFDELRRAKHTTMMLLFQLHNPHAPKFIPTCGACTTEITHGTRYHCNDCNSYDLCENCYESVITGKWAERGSKYTHDGDHTFAAIDAEADLDVQKSREERSRALKTHLELLAHAAACEGPPTCSLNNCARVKQLFEHVRMCKVTPKKSCKFCSRILTLLTVHARICRVRNASCPLPYCDRIREKMQRRRQQQQLMDDRRRQAQNQLYRVDPHQQH
jgi:E1A/CREB-binding protein